MGNVTLILITVAVMLLVGWWLDSRVRRYAAGNSACLEKKVGDVRRMLDDTLVRVTKLEDSSKKEPVTAGGDAPAGTPETSFTRDSIRTALRYNGCTLEPDDNDDWMAFKKNDLRFRVYTSGCPLLCLATGYTLNPEDEDLDSMHRAAVDVEARTPVGKITVSDDGKGLIFQAEYYCDSYIYFRDSLKFYLEFLFQTHNRFFETYEQMKEEKRKSLESLHSGSIFTSGEIAPGPKIVS